MSRLRTLFAGLAIAAVLPAAADAAVVTVRDNPNNGASVFASGLGRSVSIRHQGVNRTVGAGVFSLQYGTGGSWTDILTFCLELSAILTLPKEHERVDGADYVLDAEDHTALGILYRNFMTPDYGLRNADTGAAMQVVIWEIIEDGAADFNLDAGAFRVLTSAVRHEALNLWALLTSGDYAPARFDVLTARGTQDLIVNEVPAPGALILFGSTILAGAAIRRRRRAPGGKADTGFPPNRRDHL